MNDEPTNPTELEIYLYHNPYGSPIIFTSDPHPNAHSHLVHNGCTGPKASQEAVAKQYKGKVTLQDYSTRLH